LKIPRKRKHKAVHTESQFLFFCFPAAAAIVTVTKSALLLMQAQI